MASTIIGNAIGANTTSKVLQRENFNKEPNGLETIIESYAIQTVNRDVIVPAKLTSYDSFSSSGKSYSRMVVESVATEEQDGGITQMIVTFVGLTSSSGLPPALVRLIPTPDAGIFGPDAVIEVEFLTDKTEAQFVSGTGRTDVLQNIPIPAEINGTTLPPNPREPFYRDNAGVANYYFGYVQKALQCERRGIFLVAKKVYAEEDLTIVGTSTPNIPQN